MLKVQNFLRNNGTLEDLTAKYGIKSKVSDCGKLVILNYCQIDSPKYVELVEECRGLVLDTTDWSVVNLSMRRFYNYGERPSFDGTFKFNKAFVQEKLDGSLIHLYYYDNKWCVNTRNSFGQGKVNDLCNLSWRELFLSTIDTTKLDDLDVDYSYVFELCSYHNTVVVYHAEPKSYLLTIVNKHTGEERDVKTCDGYANLLGCSRPKTYSLSNIDAITEYINAQKGHIFEGVVGNDGKHRLKFKNSSYVALHHLKGNQGNKITSIKHIVPIVLKNEVDEIAAVFPQYAELLYEYKAKFEKAKEEVNELWNKVKDIKNQKEFAAQVVHSKWSSVLFLAKKTNIHPISHLQSAEDLLIKKL